MQNYFDVMRLAVESSMPNNTVLLDDVGMPSIMVRIPKFKIKDVYPEYTGEDATFPAFIVNGKEVEEIYISKYLNIIVGERAYSLPGMDPANTVDFDTCFSACKKKGSGWHLMSNAEWMAIALWCRKNGTIPNGNNNSGRDITAIHEHGVLSKAADGSIRTLTGTGPVTWAHDHSPAGIFDLNGNVWEWQSGLRLLDGQIQVMADNDAAANPDHGKESAAWKAILATTGALVTPETAGTLHYDLSVAGDATTTNHAINSGKAQLSTSVTHPQYTTDTHSDEYYGYTDHAFGLIEKASTVTTVPEIAKILGLYPIVATAEGNDNDHFWFRNYGERLPFRGGHWGDGLRAGLSALSFYDVRSQRIWSFGFRSAFCKLPTE